MASRPNSRKRVQLTLILIKMHCKHCIYVRIVSSKRLLSALLKTDLWTVWVEQHALYTQLLIKLDQLKSLAKVLLSNIYTVIVAISFYGYYCFILKNYICNAIRLALYGKVKQRLLIRQSMSFYPNYIWFVNFWEKLNKIWIKCEQRIFSTLSQLYPDFIQVHQSKC